MFDSKQIERDAIEAFKARKRVVIAAQSVRKITSRSCAGLHEVSAVADMKRAFMESNTDYHERVLYASSYARKQYEQSI